jgi:hypothetical protein
LLHVEFKEDYKDWKKGSIVAIEENLAYELMHGQIVINAEKRIETPTIISVGYIMARLHNLELQKKNAVAQIEKIDVEMEQLNARLALADEAKPKHKKRNSEGGN